MAAVKIFPIRWLDRFVLAHKQRVNSHTFACFKKKFTHKFKQLFSKGKYRFATMFPSRLRLGLLITNSKKQKSEATSKNEAGGDEKHFFFTWLNYIFNVGL